MLEELHRCLALPLLVCEYKAFSSISLFGSLHIIGWCLFSFVFSLENLVGTDGGCLLGPIFPVACKRGRVMERLLQGVEYTP